MKRKTKTKSKSKIQNKPKRLWHKKYDAVALAVIILVMVASESALAFNTTPADWHAGLSVLDMSGAVTTSVANLNTLFEPIKVATTGINEFYQQAAVATIQLLDTNNKNNEVGPLAFVTGVNNFYQMATNEMTNMLDLTNYTTHTWSPEVAGANVTRLK